MNTKSTGLICIGVIAALIVIQIARRLADRYARHLDLQSRRITRRAAIRSSPLSTFRRRRRRLWADDEH